MTWTKSIHQQLGVVLTIAFGVFRGTSFAIQPELGHLEVPTTVNQSPFQLALDFKLPPRGTPGKRKGAGSRTDKCSLANPNEPLTALVPGKNLGLTVSERPTFWFYIPYQSKSQRSVQFKLGQFGTDDYFYTHTFQLQETLEIVSIRLPENQELEIGKLYKWRFEVICDPNDREKNDFVYGGVRREQINSNWRSQLEQAATERERIAIYAENALWYDTLTNLVQLRRQEPEDEALKADWADLWETVELEYIKSKPIFSCCTSD